MDSYFEKGVKLNGTLWSKGSVHFEGEFEGDVFSTNNFVMGKNGFLRGNIKAINFVNQGSIEGNVHAESKLELAAGSRLVGDISTFHLVIDEGSNFEGRCKMIDGPAPADEKGKITPPEVSKPEQKEKKTGFWGKMSLLIVVLALFGGILNFKFPGLFHGVIPNQADYLVGEGNSLLKKSRYEDAEIHFRNALKLSRSNPEIHAGLGEIYLSRNNFREAGVQFQRAVELKPKNNDLRVKLATAYTQSGQFKNAEKAYKEALKIDPKNPHTLYKVGMFYKEQGSLDVATKFFQKTVSFQKGDIKSRRILADLLLQSGKYSEAIRELKSALEIDEMNPVLHFILGEALLKGGEKGMARKTFKRAEELFPKNFEAKIRRADWYFQKASLAESIKTYRADVLPHNKVLLAKK